MPRSHRICKVQDCKGQCVGNGLCRKHYSRVRTRGTVDPNPNRTGIGEPKRFLQKVLEYKGDDCLIWPYAKSVGGYGYVTYDGRHQLVCRLICTLLKGPPPMIGMQSAHSCGNGHLSCCTPAHLRWVTVKENQADRILHGTTNRGERHGKAKLTEKDVREIRLRIYKGESGRSIASDFSVSNSAISSIGRRQSWSHVS